MSSTEEQKYIADLKAQGVDVPEEQPSPEPEPEKDPEPETKEDAPDPSLTKEEPKEPPRKRSIYDEYKDKKAELKSERELREQAEQERDELKRKLEEVSSAPTAQGRADAEEDAVAYAEKLGADPDLVKRIIADARKGIEPSIPEDLKKDLDEFKAWKAQNSQAIEQQMFEAEFGRTVPFIKETFPTASQEELEAIKKQVDALSHTKDFHDKELEYVVFKNRESLGKLVSPRKRGMEGKSAEDAPTAPSQEFNPAPDFSKMSAKEMEAWENQYRALGKSDGLLTNGQGGKLII